MANEVDIALRSWCFGNTRYRSGDAETEQYVLRVTHRTMTIQRRTEEPSPGLLIVITSDNVSGVQIPSNGLNEQNVHIIKTQLAESFVTSPTWANLVGDDKKPQKHFFAIFDPNRPNFQQDWAKAISLLKQWDNIEIKDTNFFVELTNGPEEKILLTNWKTMVLNKDMKRLESRGWLNDIVIDVGLCHWYENLKRDNPNLAERIHVFNTYFYSKISVPGSRIVYDKVKSWAKNIDLFDKDYLIVPINSNQSHWYLAVIFEPKYALESPPAQRAPFPASWKNSTKSSNAPSDLPKCRILILDSFGTKRNACVRALREFLQHRAFAQCGRTPDTRKEGGRVEAIHLKVPEQTNSYDCGLYLLLFVEVVVVHADKLANAPKKYLKSIWNNHGIEGRREELKKYIEEESEKWMIQVAKENMDKTLRAFAASA